MNSPLQQKISAINTHLSGLLEESRKSLRGERQFDIELAHSLSLCIGEMAPVMAQARELRSAQPEINAMLDRYVSQIEELRGVLENVNVMLVARRDGLVAGRAQLQAVARWATSLGYTR